MEKKCTKCGVVKSLDEFNNRKDSKDGKQFICKICNKEYRKKKKNGGIKIKKRLINIIKNIIKKIKKK